MADNEAQGWQARKAGDDFEKEIETSFAPYAEANIAYLDFFPVPMSPSGQRHPQSKAPLYIPSNTAPFDVWGFHMLTGKIIAAELKSSRPQASLNIVMPKLSKGGKSLKPGKGEGVHFHQLEALRNVAVATGAARLVWSNGGDIGVLENQQIINAWAGAETAWRVLLAGHSKPKDGLRSIKWEKFTSIGYGQVPNVQSSPVPLWLRHEVIR